MSTGKKSEAQQREEEGIEHAIHGYPNILGGRPAKGVEIIGNRGPISTEFANEGVEIITPRHGHKDSRRSGD